MYLEQENKLKSKAASGCVIGSAASLQSAAGAPRDVSPIQQQLYRQRSLLGDLGVAAHGLIDSIKLVMRYDPRESPQPETNAKPVSASCVMEQEIEVMNDMLTERIRLLNQVRETICL